MCADTSFDLHATPWQHVYGKTVIPRFTPGSPVAAPSVPLSPTPSFQYAASFSQRKRKMGTLFFTVCVVFPRLWLRPWYSVAASVPGCLCVCVSQSFPQLLLPDCYVAVSARQCVCVLCVQAARCLAERRLRASHLLCTRAVSPLWGAQVAVALAQAGCCPQGGMTHPLSARGRGMQTAVPVSQARALVARVLPPPPHALCLGPLGPLSGLRWQTVQRLLLQ